MGTWCHGEAGIALTRLRAAGALGPQDDLAPALDATRRRVEQALAEDFDDLSLCHGLTGAAETLRCARAGSDDAAMLAAVAVERHLRRGDWPCAEGPAASPGLFPGLAGIGWFLLCLADPRTPSPLELRLGLDHAVSSA
jgi:lantibiotic modifying enzyme